MSISGYNKFLEIADDVKVAINQDKILEDEKWDGLKSLQKRFASNTMVYGSLSVPVV